MLPKTQGKFDASVSKIEGIADGFNFLRRMYKLKVDGQDQTSAIFRQPDLSFHMEDKPEAVKELASRMSNPTATPFHRLKKFLIYLKKTMDYCLVLEFPQAGP